MNKGGDYMYRVRGKFYGVNKVLEVDIDEKRVYLAKQKGMKVVIKILGANSIEVELDTQAQIDKLLTDLGFKKPTVKRTVKKEEVKNAENC